MNHHKQNSRRWWNRLVLLVLPALCFFFGCQGDAPRDLWEKFPTGRIHTTHKRVTAVLKGLQWMEEYLEKEDNFEAVGWDAVSIFLEISINSENQGIRRKAKRTALKFARRLEQYYLDLDDPMDSSDFTDLLDFLADMAYLGLDPSTLLEKADEFYSSRDSEETFFGVSVDNLEMASEDYIFDLLMNVYSVEKVNATYSDRYVVDFQLEDILKFLKMRKLKSFGKDKETAEDHAYLATHIAYVLSNYNRLRLWDQDASWLYRHLRANFASVLADRDVELVGEFIDVLRSLGFSETNDPMVRAGVNFLLNNQNDDGSWGRWEVEEDPYQAIHYTWCAVSGLRERFFLNNTPYSRRIRKVLTQVNNQAR